MKPETINLLSQEDKIILQIWQYMSRELLKETISALSQKRNYNIIRQLLIEDSSNTILGILVEIGHFDILFACAEGLSAEKQMPITQAVLDTKNPEIMYHYLERVCAHPSVLAEAILCSGNGKIIGWTIGQLFNQKCRDEAVAQKLIEYLKINGAQDENILKAGYDWLTWNISDEENNPFVALREEFIDAVCNMTNLKALCEFGDALSYQDQPLHLEMVLNRIVEVATQAIYMHGSDFTAIETLVTFNQDDYLILSKMLPLLRGNISSEDFYQLEKEWERMKINRGEGPIAALIEKYNIEMSDRVAFLNIWSEEKNTLPLQFYTTYLLAEEPYEPIGREIDLQYQAVLKKITEEKPKVKQMSS